MGSVWLTGWPIPEGIITVIRITLLRPCVCEGYWIVTTTAENERVKCEGLGECDTVLMRY